MRYFRSILAFLLAIVILLTSAETEAQSKLDLHGRHALKLHSESIDVAATKYYPVIIKLVDEKSLPQLDSLGVKIINRRDNLLLTFIPADKLSEVNALNSVSKMSMRQMSVPAMDKARVMSNVEQLHQGIDLPQCYDGRGVVVGITDIGFDPNHINFLDDQGLPSRIKRLVNYTDTLGIEEIISDVSDITQWETDRPKNFHATHVAGILAGSYGEQGYQGVAPASDLVVATSDLYDATILAGVEEIVDYARDVNRPAVVNMSIGSYSGPHDGSDLFCQYLDKIGEEAVICISAGNTGHRRNVINTTFTADKTSEGTFVIDYMTWCGLKLYGHVDMWSSTSQDFQVELCIYDLADSVFLYRSPAIGADALNAWSISSSDSDYETDVVGGVFDQCFSGAFFVEAELNEENNRYNIMVSYDAQCLDRYHDDLYGRYALGIIIKGEPGVHVDTYSDGIYTYLVSHGLSGFVAGQSNGSISNIACGRNVIAVGSSNSRNTTPKLDGTIKTYNFAEGGVSNYSGYGTLIDGRVLPHLCAPGNMIVSSVSTPFVKSQSVDYLNSLSLKVTHDDKDYYWLAECGTSMSSPFAAGVFALWLQADPSLTVDELRDIASSTASQSLVDAGDPRWGAGNIDALAGLREVISRAGLTQSTIDVPLAVDLLSDDVLSVTCLGANEINTRIFATDGRKVLTHCESGDMATIDVGNLQSGIYIVEITADEVRRVQRIVVR